MALPNELTEALNTLLEGEISFNDINYNAKEISKKYRDNNNDGVRLVTSKQEAISYALSRMPATYESVSDCLEKVFEKNSFEVDSVLDVGAGTGAATWALYSFFDKKNYACFEREDEMISIGKKIMKNSVLENNAKWTKFDIINDNIEEQYDLVVVSYMINELPKDQIKNIVQKLWKSTNKILLIIEPGTPNGYSNIKQIRSILVNNGAKIIAPCPHEDECPLPENDWCQFTCRVQRSKIHKILKDGISPFEDEKYSYIAFSKINCESADNRILRHPIINKGYSEYKVCSKNGIKNIKLSKKDGVVYKESKKKSSGDCLSI